jgi:diguanylate cyclase (GGDEF)-like protein
VQTFGDTTVSEAGSASVPASGESGEMPRKSFIASFLGSGNMWAGNEMWKSRLSWRIVFAVFLTIMTVQASLLALTLKEHERTKIFELEESVRNSIVPLIDPNITDSLTSPLDKSQMRRLVSFTKITGLTIYSADYRLLDMAGDPVVTILRTADDLGNTYRSADGKSYEAVFRPNDLSGRPYFIVARMDAAKVVSDVALYVQQNIIIMFLLSAFVTTVLMIALGKWLLEPILFLRDNLKAASANPEAPNILRSPYNPSDEVGGAIGIAQELIRQNAKNLRQIKSAAQSQIHKLAFFDTLTGLPNRIFFLQKLGEYVKAAGNNQGQITRLAVVTVDLDHFKDVNDSMGHNVGDAILGAIGKRLKASLPESAIIARSGEDEFAITMPLTADVLTSKDVGEKVRAIISTDPFKVFNEHFQIRCSIGVATFPDDALDPDQVLKNADIALNRAKEDGRDCIREYLEDFDKAVQARFQMLRDLRNALEHDHLSLAFQPQFDLHNGNLIGAEALIRWFKPDSSKEGGKFISPAEFIPIAEQSGLIVPIGEWVMKRACEEAKKWHDQGYKFRIAVNVSGAQFQQSDLVGYTKSVIESTGIDPHYLELEVTESAFMEDIQHTVNTLQQLHGLGVELAIDDFGTGYSSLAYLRQFPIDRLKIDQSFIRNALNNPDDASITRTIIRLAHSLNLKVIAEGVETKEHESFLSEEGCDEVQGFRYSRPVPPDKFFSLLSGYSGDLSYFD